MNIVFFTQRVEVVESYGREETVQIRGFQVLFLLVALFLFRFRITVSCWENCFLK